MAPDPEPTERDHLLDRLHDLGQLVPAFAEELAIARRQTASLRLDNQRLLELVRRLQHRHDHMTYGAHGPGAEGAESKALRSRPKAA